MQQCLAELYLSHSQGGKRLSASAHDGISYFYIAGYAHTGSINTCKVSDRLLSLHAAT
ncbi:MAG: hypothetical protein JWQ56_3551 [Pseudarthrobacter sp.]|nr:hypothetical protein [Pseudarthrobacter sp.]